MDSYKRKLVDEGYSRVYSHTDSPNTYYGDHTHPQKTAHIILSGEMEITMNGNSQTYKKGDRIDVEAGAVHSAKIGPAGCTYLIGE